MFVLYYPSAKKSLKAQGRTQQNDEPHKIHVDHGGACGGGEIHLSAVTGACGSLVIPVLEGTVTSCRAYLSLSNTVKASPPLTSLPGYFKLHKTFICLRVKQRIITGTVIHFFLMILLKKVNVT